MGYVELVAPGSQTGGRAIMRAARPYVSVVLSALMLVGGTLQGCTSWKSRPIKPAMFATGTPTTTIRVTFVKGGSMFLHAPVIRQDSLIGIASLGPQEFYSAGRVAFPLAEIREVAVKRVDLGKTTVLIVGIGVAALMVREALKPEPVRPITYGGDFTFSCPLVYSWDGKTWRLDSGTFGGAIMRPLARTDVDNLDFATTEQGNLRLKLANELNETDFVDALDVLAVDHDPGMSIAPDSEGKLHALVHPIAPTRASDFRGRDALARVRAADGWSWESNPSGRDPALAADVRDGLELVFRRQRDARSARLVIEGNNTVWASYLLKVYLEAHGRASSSWYDSLETDPARARAMRAMLAREAFLTAKVWAPEGWVSQGTFWEAGPEIAKRQVMVLDLSRCEGDTVRVRLESVPSFWQLDRVALDLAAERPFTVTELALNRAVSPDGRDLRPLLTAIDGSALRMETGDSAELSFRTPGVPQGKARSYLVRSHGWYRIHTTDHGDLDLALLETVSGRPLGVSKAAVARANQMLQRLEEAAR